MLKVNPVFLPAEPIKGRCGYYPAQPEEWHDLPLPLKASTSYPVGSSSHIVGVIFDVWLDELKMKADVELHPANVFQALFTSTRSPQLYTVSRVRWADGKTSFASWLQDSTTGCYCIFVGASSGTAVLKQGGYSGHMPANVYYDEDQNKYMLRHVENERCYSNL